MSVTGEDGADDACEDASDKLLQKPDYPVYWGFICLCAIVTIINSQVFLAYYNATVTILLYLFIIYTNTI